MTLESAPKRRRGAQPGNTNALKHGYYAAKLLPQDRAELQDYLFTGVEEEAEILRVYIRRVVELTTQAQNLPLDQAVQLLRILTLSITSLAHILRTDQLLFRNQVTAHDRAFRRRRDLRWAIEDEIDDARLAAELAARCQAGGQPALSTSANASADGEDPSRLPLNALTFTEALVRLGQKIADIDAAYPAAAADDLADD